MKQQPNILDLDFTFLFVHLNITTYIIKQKLILRIIYRLFIL
jgi:hypothetical protein